MSSKQPGLEHLSGRVVITLPSQLGVHPCMALHASLSLEDNRTKLSPCGEHLKARAIGPFVAGVKVLKDLSRRFVRKSLQNLVDFHAWALARVAESEWENTPESSTLKI